MDKTNHFIHEAKILDQRQFYSIFDTLQKEKPAFSNGSMEVLISITYRRGDGFRWRDDTVPYDLSFLKFNPIDNLNDDDNLIENYCFHFSIIVDKNSKDGYGTKWYKCDEMNSINYTKKLFYLLCSYSKIDQDNEIQKMIQRPFQIIAKQKECLRTEIPVKINNMYLCYVHIIKTYLVILILI
ncbi:unnamed protein product [Brugia timori]|uniref:MATH domain-containing protein n=1 Tax=Brugia timori TaxID=42155 RepID=A0A0R3QBD0_9BILA|nr:unnamed protein product [Brugia timori]